MHTEKVQFVGDSEETVFLQCVKHVIKDPSDGHPDISPQPFNSAKVQMFNKMNKMFKCSLSFSHSDLLGCYKLSQDFTFDCEHFFQTCNYLCLFLDSGT